MFNALMGVNRQIKMTLADQWDDWLDTEFEGAGVENGGIIKTSCKWIATWVVEAY